jgi:tetratricopeptide (TPR) repeat protein
MQKRKSASWIGLFAAAALFVSVSAAAEGLGKNKNLVTQSTTYDLASSTEGIGANQQAAVSKAADLVQQERYDEAGKILDGVLSRFAKLMRDSNAKYVAFRSDEDFKQYEAAFNTGQGGKVKIMRVHDSFTQALQLKAYIASSLQKWDVAIDYLDKKIAYAPFEAQPHLEKGYVLNASGKPADGLESYKLAYELTVKHNAAPQEQAAALRGMGSTLIELGRLDEAEDAYNKSLEIEPGNRIALGELEYIAKLRAQGR